MPFTSEVKGLSSTTQNSNYYQSMIADMGSIEAEIALLTGYSSWLIGTTYALDDIRWNPTDSKLYISIQASNTGNQPDVSPLWWSEYVDNDRAPRGNHPVTMTGSDVTLTAQQFDNAIFTITGTLTTNVNLIIPDNIVQPFTVSNGTSGAFTVTVKHSATSGVLVDQGDRVALTTDGTTVIAYTGVTGSALLASPNTFTDKNTFGDLVNFATGSTIASSATVNLSTADGNLLHITGTVTTSAFTMNSGQQMVLIADGAWPLTYNATTMKLNTGGANYTCSVGDRLKVGYDGTTTMVTIVPIDGTAPLGGGSWNMIGTVEASASATLTVTGLDSTYDTYAIAFSDLVPATDGVQPLMRVGDSGGIDSGASDYQYAGIQANTAASIGGVGSAAANSVSLNPGAAIGSAAGEGYGGIAYLHRPGDGTTYPTITASSAGLGTASAVEHHSISGARNAVITLDRVQFLFSSGNIATGRMTVWGISHD